MMDKRLILVRAAYWVGIFGDAAAAALMTFPRLDASLLGAGIVSSVAFGLGVRRGAHLMAGWTALLFWADRRPVERRGVLLLTLCPVEAGRLIYLAYAVMAGFTSFQRAVPSIVIEAVFIAVFAAGYLNARALSAKYQEGTNEFGKH